MHPDMTLALSFFATQWVWNARINYDLAAKHPTQSTTTASCREP
jgi:hypothetical protein